MKQDIKVLIIEDHEVVVWALTTVIEKSFAEAVLYSASGFKGGLKILQENTVDLVILDIDLAGGNSPSMIPELRSIQLQVPILVYTGMPEEEYSIQYLTAGANGYLSKGAPFSFIPEAIALVLSGKKYISPLTHEVIADKYLRVAPKTMLLKGNLYLTKRETEIVILLLKGKWTKEIADTLGLKLTTVSTHKTRIFEKLGVENQIELFLKVQKELPELLEQL